MITVIQGVADAGGRAELDFTADRIYGIYAMEGVNLDGKADIQLGYASGPAPGIEALEGAFITLKQWQTTESAAGVCYDPVYWNGHFIMMISDTLFMRATQALPGNRLLFKILLMPVAKLAMELAGERKR
ncbi:unnamed protein product [marine sediment metagenome]|uniref:Uncharacterized protein n=1 Tax=marine sediment metagenome TaxID=412755 RepID=X1M070_9ZZZZ